MYSTNRYTKHDWLIALFLAVITIFTALCCLDGGSVWHDYAAYINEAIAIAEGRFDEMTKLNLFMHPSDMTFLSPEDTSLTYSWGFPLLLAPIYLLFGFDRVNYSTVIYYKLPGVFCLGMTAFVLYLFYRRRFTALPSLLLTLLLCLNASLLNAANLILSDLPGLAFAMASLLTAECFFSAGRMRCKYLLGGLLGFLLWSVYVIRLNGSLIVLFVLLGHGFYLLRNRKRTGMPVLRELAPYLAFAAFLGLSYLIFPAATSNNGDLLLFTRRGVKYAISYYWNLGLEWLGTLCAHVAEPALWTDVTGIILLLLIVLGVCTNGFGRNLHLTLFSAATLGGLLLLPYTQGIRYLFNVLPLALMYLGYGIRFVFQHIFKKSKQRLAAVCLVLILCAFSASTVNYTITRFQARAEGISATDNAYTPYSIQMYRYIQENLPEDSVLLFYKPRALFLNTGRLAFKPQVNKDLIVNTDQFMSYQPHYHAIEDADYALLYLDKNQKQLSILQAELEESSTQLELIYQDEFYTLFQIQ